MLASCWHFNRWHKKAQARNAWTVAMVTMIALEEWLNTAREREIPGKITDTEDNFHNVQVQAW